MYICTCVVNGDDVVVIFKDFRPFKVTLCILILYVPIHIHGTCSE